MKIAFVIHRYGLNVVGGSEYHCRRIAEQLAVRHEVEVLSTTAGDYITWKDGYPAGLETVNGIRVRRFRIERRRDLSRFKEISDLCFFDGRHSRQDELEWIRLNGPESPELVRYIREHASDYDAFIFYCFRYYQTYFGLPEVAEKTILVPTAEDEPAVRMAVFSDFFRRPAGILFLTPEERELVGSVSSGALPPSEIIGFGVDIPPDLDPEAFRKRRGLTDPFILYIGRIDRNKGCDGLFRYFQGYLKGRPRDVDLVLGGSAALPIPDHPRIKPLGFLSDREKFEALQAAKLLVMPSPYESLCIVVLEAWKSGRPTLINGLCRVLRGQTLRSQGGLYYTSFAEFREALDFLLDHPEIADGLGRSGRDYMEKNFEWPQIIGRVEGLLAATIPRR
jgi:glycosyltransferase involved in cell wall biosynthesis